ncbi:NADH:flavin oxidoreductase/NADH oxidase [Pseudorhizobium flavum]|uniref:NADH:flavin oxidoreductase/NADH oxidase n=1 Tax=Pseudorhizobium flavum TaxID=1335061 RepID=UPI0009853160|nr:NADH:flavin oxidoreductase/NADH oxidase [Pseudorhizobium flavum]
MTINDVALLNRIVVSPMGQQSADNAGNATDWYLMHLGNLAVSGAGLVIVEATAVEPRGRVSTTCLGLWSDQNATALERVLRFYRANGDSKWGIQLAHAGRKGSVNPAWKGRDVMREEDGGWRVVGPSPIAYPGRDTPEALEAHDIAYIIKSFADAATSARDLGFDAVEIHAAHGYLLHSFLSPLTNRRTDAHGGSLENRMRFPLEVVRAVRAVWPKDRILGIRVNGTDWAQGGWTIEEAVDFAKETEKAGVDYITASSGGTVADQTILVGPSYQIPLAAAIKEAVDVPVIGVGLITEPAQAEDIVSTGRADLVALGRAMLYNPRWVWHASFELNGKVGFPGQYERCHPKMRTRDPLSINVNA